MTVRLLDRSTTTPIAQPTDRPAAIPDPGYDALRRLAGLRDELAAARPVRTRNRWKEPAVFFFDPRRQAELETARSTPVAVDPFAELSNHIAAELPMLLASVEVRRVGRAIDGLQSAAEALAPACLAAKDLANLLAIPDDEIFLVLHPERRAGFRLAARGLVDLGQFHILLANAVTGDSASGFLPGPRMPERFVAVCRDVNPTTPAGVPMVAEARFQMYDPAALRADGTLPAGCGACEHWLWPTAALASVPRIDGERVVLLGPLAYHATWDVTRRFPAMPAELRVVEALSPARVAERLTKLTGNLVSPILQPEEERLSKAA